jgi:hypothetical protein
MLKLESVFMANIIKREGKRERDYLGLGIARPFMGEALWSHMSFPSRGVVSLWRKLSHGQL